MRVNIRCDLTENVDGGVGDQRLRGDLGQVTEVRLQAEDEPERSMMAYLREQKVSHVHIGSSGDKAVFLLRTSAG